jgi:hypothetical protein
VKPRLSGGPGPLGDLMSWGGGAENMFDTKLFDVFPDYKPITFEICRSSIVLIQF